MAGKMMWVAYLREFEASTGDLAPQWSRKPVAVAESRQAAVNAARRAVARGEGVVELYSPTSPETGYVRRAEPFIETEEVGEREAGLLAFRLCEGGEGMQ